MIYGFVIEFKHLNWNCWWHRKRPLLNSCLLFRKLKSGVEEKSSWWNTSTNGNRTARNCHRTNSLGLCSINGSLPLRKNKKCNAHRRRQEPSKKPIVIYFFEATHLSRLMTQFVLWDTGSYQLCHLSCHNHMLPVHVIASSFQQITHNQTGKLISLLKGWGKNPSTVTSKRTYYLHKLDSQIR